MPSKIELHRVFAAPPERLFRAFTDASALTKWLPPHGFTATVDHLDARVGGSFRMTFTNFSTGKGQPFGGEYLEIKPNEKLSYTDRFDDPNLPGTMVTTIQFRQVMVGTDVRIIQEGIPDAIPPEACYLGWQESLALLAQLVHAQIPD